MAKRLWIFLTVKKCYIYRNSCAIREQVVKWYYSSLGIIAPFSVVRKREQLSGACNYPKCNTLSFLKINQIPSLSPNCTAFTDGLETACPLKSVFLPLFCFVNNSFFCLCVHLKMELKLPLFHSALILLPPMNFAVEIAELFSRRP